MIRRAPCRMTTVTISASSTISRIVTRGRVFFDFRTGDRPRPLVGLNIFLE